MEGGKVGGRERGREKGRKTRLRNDSLSALTSYRSTFLLRTLDLNVEYMNISIP